MLGGSLLRAVFLGTMLVLPFALQGPQSVAGQHDGGEAMVGDFLAAARANDVEGLRRGLEAGVPVDARDGRGRTALLIATQANAVDAARALIAAGADVNAQDDIRDSPFLYAGAEGRLEILKITVAAGADLASVNRYGGTALIPAAHHGHAETVRYLLTTDIDVNHVNDLGWTALMEAVILGDGGRVHREIVELLLQNGADPGIGDREGVTPLQHARRRGFADMAKLLEAAEDRRR